MAVEDDFESGILRPDPVVHHADIFHHGLPSAVIHIAEVFRVLYGSSVAAVVVNDADKTVCRQELHQRDISFLVLAHSVHQLDNAARRLVP